MTSEMYTYSVQWIFLALAGSISALQDSVFTAPMMFHYENCTTTPSPFTFDLYYANTFESDVESYPLTKTTIGDKQSFKLHHGSKIVHAIQLHPTGRYSYNFRLDYYCYSGITQYYSSAVRDPTVSLIASVKWPNFTLVYSLLPDSKQPDSLISQEYNYYLLMGSFRPRNCIDAFVIVAVSPDITNITIESTVDLIALRDGNVSAIIIIPENSTETISMEKNEVLWIEVMTEDCGNERNLSGLFVKATQSIQVFTARAQCSEPDMFSYDSHVLHQMPPSYKWGKTYITDLLQLNTLPVTSTSSTIVSFTFLAIENMTTVTITWYRGNHQQQNDSHSTQYTLTSGKPFVTTFDSTFISNGTTHVFIQGSNPILVVYELYSLAENKMYFSVLLQPVEWFSNQQSAALVKPLQQATELQYHITVVVPSNFYDPTNLTITGMFETNQSLDRYDYFDAEHVYTAGDFLVLYMEINSTNITNETDKQVLIRHKDPCAKLGVIVYSYADTTSYAHSNGYVLNDTLPDGVNCRSRPTIAPSETTTTTTNTFVIPVASAVTCSVLLVVIIVVLVLVAKRMCKYSLSPNGEDKEQLLPNLTEDPGYDGFVFDVFLSFAEQDRDFVERVLYIPLTDKGYVVFWHHEHFICGFTIEQNIVRATQSSRRIIFVCSEHFQRSTFCQKELKFGLHCHYKDRTRRVIPIVLQEEYCPDDLKHFNQIRVNNINISTSAEIERLIHKLDLGDSIQSHEEQTNR